MKLKTARGFTLVELLIVIALLGVIATIVIAAINPIEQANRSTDAGMKADGSNLVSALQRYYTGQNKYPWMVVNPTSYDSAEDAYPWTNAQNEEVGICGATCAVGGSLINAEELQIAFLSRKFVTATAAEGALFVGKGQGSSSSVFVCWVPKSKSARTSVIANAKVANLTSAIGVGGLPTYGTDCADANDTDWNVAAGALPTCAECVPE